MISRPYLFLLLLVPFAVSAAEKTPTMPPEWLVCKTSADCGLILRQCGFGLAVNLAHKAEAEEFVDKNRLYPELCTAAPHPPDSAACENGVCTGTYSWKHK